MGGAGGREGNNYHFLLFGVTTAKRTESKNRMQITEFPARLSQDKRVLREI